MGSRLVWMGRPRFEYFWPFPGSTHKPHFLVRGVRERDAEGRTRTDTGSPPLDFESSVSANFTTPARETVCSISMLGEGGRICQEAPQMPWFGRTCGATAPGGERWGESISGRSMREKAAGAGQTHRGRMLETGEHALYPMEDPWQRWHGSLKYAGAKQYCLRKMARHR